MPYDSEYSADSDFNGHNNVDCTDTYSGFTGGLSVEK
jgi:hypothetical protein